MLTLAIARIATEALSMARMRSWLMAWLPCSVRVFTPVTGLMSWKRRPIGSPPPK
ncbi:MAG: hypothetical protein ACLQVN_02920 [Bryobacteraceae bacterium]